MPLAKPRDRRGMRALGRNTLKPPLEKQYGASGGLRVSFVLKYPRRRLPQGRLAPRVRSSLCGMGGHVVYRLDGHFLQQSPLQEIAEVLFGFSGWGAGCAPLRQHLRCFL